MQWVEWQTQRVIPDLKFWVIGTGKVSPASIPISELDRICRQIRKNGKVNELLKWPWGINGVYYACGLEDKHDSCLPSAWSLYRDADWQRCSEWQNKGIRALAGAFLRCYHNYLLTEVLSYTHLPPTSGHVPTLCDAEHHLSLMTLFFSSGHPDFSSPSSRRDSTPGEGRHWPWWRREGEQRNIEAVGEA